MMTALLKKEWLKVRWIVLGLLLLHLGVLIVTYYDLANLFKVYRANEVILQLIAFEVVFYSKVQYAALLSGLAVGVFQFFPEIIQSRLKLTLHLPVNELAVLFRMLSVGAIVLILFALIDTALLAWMIAAFLPMEFVSSMITTSLPWHLGGLAAYFWVMGAFIEPGWTKRVILGLTGLAIVSLFYDGSGFSSQLTVLPHLLLLAVASGIVIILSGHNFKRGIA